MDWAFFHLSSRGQSLLQAVTGAIPCVSPAQAGLPVPQVLTAGEFVQEHLGRCLCGFLCGPCDDSRKQEEIQNCLKARNLWNPREVMVRDMAETNLPASHTASCVCPRSCLHFIQLHSSRQFCMQIRAADVTHACVNTSVFLQHGWSSDWVLLNNRCTHQKFHWLQPFSYSLLKTLWRMVTPFFFGHSRGLTHKYEQNKIRWLKWLQPQLCPHCPIPRRSCLQPGWLWKATPELL